MSAGDKRNWGRGPDRQHARDGVDENHYHPPGGRQGGGFLTAGGGGYQDIYTSPTAPLKKNRSLDSEDPRLAELEDMGLPERWLKIARAIGFDAFIAVWQILDEDNPSADGMDRGEQVRVWIPRMARYVMYQRKLFILSLQHLPTDEIIRRLRADHGITLHRRTVQRVLLDARRRRCEQADNSRP